MFILFHIYRLTKSILAGSQKVYLQNDKKYICRLIKYIYRLTKNIFAGSRLRWRLSTSQWPPSLYKPSSRATMETSLDMLLILFA